MIPSYRLANPPEHDPAGNASDGTSRPARRVDGSLPLDARFLLRYGIAIGCLESACKLARELACDAGEVLIANGTVSAARYYLCLADTLGLPFAEAAVMLARIEDPSVSIRHGYAPLAESPGFRGTGGWLLAPRGQRIRLLLIAKSFGLPLPRFTITTPAHLSVLVRRVAAAQLAEAASHGLGNRDPGLSARHAVDALRSRSGAGLFALILCLMGAAPHAALLALAPLFLSAVVLRSAVCALGFHAIEEAVPLPDAALPDYGIIVPLYREAHMVPSLIRNLLALDYPAAKLEIKFMIEGDDTQTRLALEREDLPPHFEIVTVPAGRPRTKPRALNVALALLRAELVTVYDAEDRPEPDQLRKAAARFNAGPPELACLQARLDIGTGDGRILTKLFAIEYAALFHLFNRGIAATGLPFALGGTSNHFRADILRRVGGWDAWNVAEDADLGFRLARQGYRVDMLASATLEQAPLGVRGWFHQRRRWIKGWMQTILVLARHPLRTARDYGLARTAVLVLMATSLVIGPLLSPLVAVALVADVTALWRAAGHDPASRLVACLWVPVLASGMTTIVWTSYAGMRQAGLKGCWRSLPLCLPYQMLIAAAAWCGLLDLMRQPYHWCKSDHYAPSGERHSAPGRGQEAGSSPNRFGPAVPRLNRMKSKK